MLSGQIRATVNCGMRKVPKGDSSGRGEMEEEEEERRRRRRRRRKGKEGKKKEKEKESFRYQGKKCEEGQ